jgi:hypothetical protein
LIFVIFVDDILITSNNNDLILRLKKQLTDSFGMTNHGTLHYFLGLQVLPVCYGFFTSQYKYVMNILTCFNMDDCKPYATPFQSGVNLTKTFQTLIVDATFYQQLVDCIIYVTHSQPNIYFVVRVVSRFMQDPK